MPVCAVCRSKEVSQDHHIIYEPFEIKIGVCLQCHNEIHGHGTGPPKMPDSVKYAVKGIRGIPEELWKIIKIRSTIEDKTIGEYVSTALAQYLSKQTKTGEEK